VRRSPAVGPGPAQSDGAGGLLHPSPGVLISHIA